MAVVAKVRGASLMGCETSYETHQDLGLVLHLFKLEIQ